MSRRPVNSNIVQRQAAMISELTILILQVAAAIFMGYDYFISSKIKDRLDKWAKNRIHDIRIQSNDAIKGQIQVLKRNLRTYVIAFAVMVAGTITLRFVAVFEQVQGTILIAIAFGIISVVLILGAFKTVLDRLVIEGLAPMVIPLGARVLAAYLLFTSKGVIAGVGMIFLLASFWARYANTTGA